MKKIIIAALLLYGCDASYKDVKQHYKLPDDLSDCKIYELNGDSSSRTLYVVRCAEQTTTSEQHSCGKGCINKNSVTVDNYK